MFSEQGTHKAREMITHILGDENHTDVITGCKTFEGPFDLAFGGLFRIKHSRKKPDSALEYRKVRTLQKKTRAFERT